MNAAPAVTVYAVLCPSSAKGLREFERYTSEIEAQNVAACLRHVGCNATVIPVSDPEAMP